MPCITKGTCGFLQSLNHNDQLSLTSVKLISSRYCGVAHPVGLHVAHRERVCVESRKQNGATRSPAVLQHCSVFV